MASESDTTDDGAELFAPVVEVRDLARDDRLGAMLAGRYRLDAVIGSGGMATVYRGEDTQLRRPVAVKILHDDVATEPQLRGRFEREAEVLAALSHPHIVSLLDYGVEGGAPFLVMEMLRGKTLGELLKETKRLPFSRAVNITTQILGALNYAHGEGLLHRDLKPDNVFLSELKTLGDHVQLLDFGFAKFVAGERGVGPPLTQVGKVFGTPRYMAPEQLTGRSVDVRADLYAVAVMFYEMLTGLRPHEGAIRDVLRAKVARDAPSLSSVAPDLAVTDEMEAFFRTALAIDRNDRYGDGAAMVRAIETLRDPSDITTPQAMTTLPPPGLPVPLILGGLVLGVLALGCVGSALLFLSAR